MTEPVSVGEHRERLAAERGGLPHLVYRDGDGAQVIVALRPGVERVVVGRAEECEVALSFDRRVSRAHAELVRAGGEWWVADEGMSRNGTWVNGERVTARRRLVGGDVIRVGEVSLHFADPAPALEATELQGHVPEFLRITDTQRRVLVALCRPLREAGAFASPATNAGIAAEVHLGVDAVKVHLRTLFGRFGLQDLPQNQKRARLAERALELGVVRRAEL
jgi:hypothetical protein